MFTLQKYVVQKTVIEQEFFKDNHKIIKHENNKIENARKTEENANEALAEYIPKLEATVEALSSAQELDAQMIMENIVQDGPMGEIGRKIIKY